MGKIKFCKIIREIYKNEIHVLYDNGSEGELKYECIGAYYPDELSFSEEEFIGLTEDQANKLMYERDKAYLRS